MKFSCDQCQAQYMIADEKVGPKGVKVRCKKCGNIISVTKDAAAADTASGAPAAGGPGSAFDDLFGQNGGAGAPSEEERSPTKVFTTSELNKVREEQALAKGDEQAQSSEPAPAAAASTASTKAEWYVAINDEQVGPISDADIEERWDKGQIQAASLAWKAGLPDWAPISQVADLQHLTSRPQQQQAAKPAPVAQPEHREEEKKEVVTWRPSGASALADLAKEATIEEPKKPEPQAEASPFGSDINLQSQGGSADPFGSPAFAGAASGPSTVWQFPTSTAKKSGGTSKALLGAIAFVGVLLLGGIGFLGVQMMNVSKQQQQSGLQQPPPVVTPPVVTPPPVAVAPTGQPVAPSGAVAALTPPKNDAGNQQAGNDNKDKGGKSKGKGKGKDKGDKGGDDSPAATPTPEPKKDPGGGKKDGFDDLLAGKKATSEVKEKLSRDDVLGTVNANKAAILKCANAFSNGGGKLPPKLMAKWTIKASGFTENVEMASPELKGTPVDACVVSAIKKWRFPEFRSGEIPVTFPFAIAQ